MFLIGSNFKTNLNLIQNFDKNPYCFSRIESDNLLVMLYMKREKAFKMKQLRRRRVSEDAKGRVTFEAPRASDSLPTIETTQH